MSEWVNAARAIAQIRVASRVVKTVARGMGGVAPDQNSRLRGCRRAGAMIARPVGTSVARDNSLW